MAFPSLSLSLQFLLFFTCPLGISLPQHSLASRVDRIMLSSSEKDEKPPEQEAAAPAETPNRQNPSPQLPNFNLPKLSMPPLPQLGNGNLPKLNLPPLSLPKAQQIPSSVPPLPSVSLPKPSGILPPLPSIPGGFQIPSIPFLTPPPPSTQQTTP